MAGCGNQKPAGEKPARSAPAATIIGKGTIGVSVLTLTNPFFKVIGDTITEEARKQGYEVIVTSGEFDVALGFNLPLRDRIQCCNH